VTRPQTTGELESLRSLAYDVLRRDPAARDAHLRLYEVEQMLGSPQAAIGHLRMALRTSRIVTSPAAHLPAQLSVLALTRVAPWEANTPLELIIDADRVTLHRYYIDDTDTALGDEPLPPYDALFNSIAESDAAAGALRLARAFADRAGREPMNVPEVVARIGRMDVAARFADSATIVAPPIERATAAELLARTIAGPLIVRPVGSQAGIGLARIDDAAALRAYLTERSDPQYFVMPFVDYSNDDGFFRKYRVMFVEGTPYACHLAISPRWMIHYYNAAMAENQWMRDEEARFIANFGSVFSCKLADALREIAAAIPLDYFGIDCAITRDGRLLLFEADAAMLVHGTDPPDLYPYKRAGFERIQSAFNSALLSSRFVIPSGVEGPPRS
jgi:glutathione synthase/RimK-type ligase-like ATP-grasp enzyme